MAEVNVIIHGQSYGIACDDGQEARVQELGRYVDQRLREIAGAGAATTESHLLVLAGLVMADEIFEQRDTIENLSNAPQMQSAQPAQEQAPAADFAAQEEASAAAEIIEQLVARIDGVSDRIKQI